MHVLHQTFAHDRHVPPLQNRRSMKRRRLVLAAAVQLPVLIWLASAYLLATSVFEQPWPVALAVAIGLGYVVFLVECVVIATPLNWATLVARLVLTVLMSALGAVAVDITLFRGDIEERLREDAVTQMQREQIVELNRKQLVVDQATTSWKEALREMNDEAGGRGRTVLIGCGPVCRRLEKQADERHVELRQAQAELTTYQSQAVQAVQDKRAAVVTPDAGLLQRLAALHGFMRDHPVTLLAWGALFFVVMLIESTVVIAKLAGGRTLDERLEALREDVIYGKALRYQTVLCEPDQVPSQKLGISRRPTPTRLDEVDRTKASTARSRRLT